MIINPASLQKISLMVYNRESFYNQGFTYVPFLNVFSNIISPSSVKMLLPIYDFENNSLNQSLRILAEEPDNYYLGLIKQLSVDSIEFYQPVETYSYGNYISMPQNNVLKTSGKISIPGILPYNSNNYNSYFQELIWKLGAYMFVPFFFNSTIKPNNIGGPLFVNTFSIDLSENGSVNIDIGYLGGTLILPPQNYGDNGLQDIIYSSGIGTNSQIFRTIKNYDCFVMLNVNDDLDGFIGVSSIYSSYNYNTIYVEGNNISSISLQIDNQLEAQYTSNDGVNKTIKSGMRYLAQKDRIITGSLTFKTSSKLNDRFLASTNNSLVLYFGGPYYFPMRNVSIQPFGLNVSGGDATYTHTIKFNALLQSSNSLNYYQKNQFDLNINGLFSTPSAQVYTTPQSPYEEQVEI